MGLVLKRELGQGKVGGGKESLSVVIVGQPSDVYRNYGGRGKESGQSDTDSVSRGETMSSVSSSKPRFRNGVGIGSEGGNG